MAIGPSNSASLASAVAALDADFLAVQEVDNFLERSGCVSQMEIIASSMQTSHFSFAPSIIGTPGEKWKAAKDLNQSVNGYGIGIASKIPVIAWDRLELGRSRIGMPLLVPADEKNKARVRAMYVRDEPRIALAATLENGWTLINTHLSFVPVVNFVQLVKLKKWADYLANLYRSRTIILGDLNLPKDIPTMGSKWCSLARQNTYPSWGAKIQFDYILSKEKSFESIPTIKTGISDHLPISIKIN